MDKPQQKMSTDRNKKKILFLITKSNWGGAQRYVHDLAINLPREQYKCVVAAGGDGEMIGKLEASGIRVIKISGLQRDISFRKEIQSSREILKILKSERPDVLHINSSKAGAIGAVLGRWSKIPKIIFTAHGWAFNEDRSTVSSLLIKFIHWLTVLTSHQSIAVSNAMKEQMDWPGVKNKLTVIHNGRAIPEFIDRDTAQKSIISFVPRLESYKNDFWSVTIGELHSIKQHEITIKALASVIKEQPKARHIIIGKGQERTNLENLVAELGLENNVFFTGAILEAAQYLKAFDLFILSSRSEALGYVVIEAAMAKLPIIASKVGGIPEIVKENSGILIPAGNYYALAEAYKELLQNPEKRSELAISALNRSADFGIKNMINQTEILY